MTDLVSDLDKWETVLIKRERLHSILGGSLPHCFNRNYSWRTNAQLSSQSNSPARSQGHTAASFPTRLPRTPWGPGEITRHSPPSGVVALPTVGRLLLNLKAFLFTNPTSQSPWRVTPSYSHSPHCRLSANSSGPHCILASVSSFCSTI